MYSYAQDLFREKRKVVIYARVSTEHDAQLSALENQIDWYKPILDAHLEWELVGTYIDEGITGTSAEKREQFMRMIADAKNDKFDLIITREVSRFARNTVDTLQYTRELRRIGVEVFFLNDNIKTFDGDGELRLTIMATLAQDESRKTSIRVKSGQQTSMEKGVVYGNGNILGYKRVGKEMVIDPEQAKTVRLIYDLYLAGNGLTKIKYELESRGIKTALGKRYWSATVISGVLQNTFYHGVMTYHKEYVPDYLTQKRSKNKGELQLTQVPGSHEPIVTKEEYDRVQAIMERKRKIISDSCEKKKRMKGKTPNKYVWGKLLICSCGYKFGRHHHTGSGETKKYAYTCYKKKVTGSATKRKKQGLDNADLCLSPTLSEIKLETIAAFILNHYVKHKDEVVSLAKKIISEHVDDTQEKDDNSLLINSLNDELSKLERKFDMLIEMRTDGEISKEQFKFKADEIEKERARIREKLSSLTSTQPRYTKDDFSKKLIMLEKLLEKYVDFSVPSQIPEQVVEAFIKKIVVFPDHTEWYLRINDGDEDPLKTVISGNMRSGLNITINNEIEAQFSSVPHRLLSNKSGNRLKTPVFANYSCQNNVSNAYII